MKNIFAIVCILFIASACTEEPIEVSDGQDGTDGLTTLIDIVNEPSGENCQNGGLRVLVGLDDNRNSILDDNEVDAETYVCNGNAGSDGADGSNGTNGSDGVNADQVIVLSQNEPAGANCLEGGLKITIGYDTNNNDTLEATEVTSVSYVCNGENGSDADVQKLGKVTVILTGDITNEEARQIVAEQVGTQTQHIRVDNTTNLDSLIINNVSELMTLTVTNSTLKYIHSESVTTVYEMFTVTSPDIRTVSFPNLVDYYGVTSGGFGTNSMIIQGDTLDLVDFSSLKKTTNLNLPTLTTPIQTINLASLESGVVSTLFPEEFVFPSNLDLPDVTFSFRNLNKTTIVSLPFRRLKSLLLYAGNYDFEALEMVDFLFVSQTPMKSIDLPNLVSASISVSRNDSLQSLSFPVLDSAAFSIFSNNELTAFNTPNVKSMYENIAISSNNKLETLSFPSLLRVQNLRNPSAFIARNNLSEQSINDLLVAFDNATLPTAPLTLNLTQNAGTATGAGLTAKTSLESKGHTVQVD